MEERRKRLVDQFLEDARQIYTPRIRKPDPEEDYGMYYRLEEAFDGLVDYLERWRRNYGRIGYGAANLMSDLQKELIERIKAGEEERPAYILRAMEVVANGFREEGSAELPDPVDRFASTIDQEGLEGELFALLWPVVVGQNDSVPPLPSWRDFKGNLQAYIYGFLDVVSEMAKAVTEEVVKDMSPDDEFALFERFLAIANSIVIALSTVRHSPGYVINNGYGRWMAFSERFRRIQGAVANVRRDYALRRSVRRMIREALQSSN